MFFDSYRNVRWFDIRDNYEFRYPEIVNVLFPEYNEFSLLEPYGFDETLYNLMNEPNSEIVKGAIGSLEYDDISSWRYLFDSYEEEHCMLPLNVKSLLLIFDECVLKNYMNIVSILFVLCKHFVNEEYKNIFLEYRDLTIRNEKCISRELLDNVVDCSNCDLLKFLLDKRLRVSGLHFFGIIGITTIEYYMHEYEHNKITDYKMMRFLVSKGYGKTISITNLNQMIEMSPFKSPALFRELLSIYLNKSLFHDPGVKHEILKYIKDIVKDHPAHYYMLP